MAYSDFAETPPPSNLNAEAAVLGAILYNNQDYYRVSEALRAEDFFHPANKWLFRRMSAMIETGKVADYVTLSEIVGAEPKMQDAGGMEYVMMLLDNAAIPIEIPDYAKILTDLSVRRSIMELGTKLHQSANRPQDGEKPHETLEKARSGLQEIEDRKLRTSAWESARASSARLMADSTRIVAEGRPDQFRGLKTGLADLDAKLKGLRGGNLIILAGRPGMAKSGTAGNIAANVADGGNVVGFFQLEMKTEEMDARLQSSKAHKIGAGRVEYADVISGQIGQNQLAIIRDGDKAIPQTLFVDTTPRLSLADIASRARALKRKEGRLDLLVIDYLQIMRIETERGENYSNAVGRTTAGLKELAKSLDVPIVLLSQLSRNCEQRENKRPLLSDLRDSGAIEQDADIVIFVYRDEYYLKDQEPPHGEKGSPAAAKWNQWYAEIGDARGKIELIVAKIRMGKVGRCHLYYDAGTDALVDSKQDLEIDGGLF